MITDEIIFETAVPFEEPAELWNGQTVFNKHSLLAYTHRIIALAQQVKPLEFVQIDKTTKKADTVFGPYFICAYIHETRFSFPEDKYYERKCETEADAIEAANEDFRKRVLECLVWGGV